MQQKKLVPFVILLLLTLLTISACDSGASTQGKSGSSSSTAQTTSDPRVDWLRTQVAPIQSQEMGSGFADFERFGSNFDNKRIVGLGEATHGTQDFDKLRNRLVEYLVSQKGYRFIVLEAEIGDGITINKYITQGIGTPQQALAPLLIAWNAPEYATLLSWLRAWNQGHPNDMVRFYGCDNQDWKAIVNTFEQQFAASSDAVAALTDVRRYGTQLDAFQGFSSSDYAHNGLDEAKVQARVTMLKDGIRSAIQRIAPFLPPNDASREAHFTHLLYKNLLGYIDATDPVLNYYVTTNQWAKFWKRFQERTLHGDPRETALASNVLSISDLEGSASKGIFWAHDAHVGRGYDYPGTRSSGAMIADKLGDAYFAVATDFYAGQFIALDTDKLVMRNFTVPGIARASLSSKLNQLGYGQLWLTLRGRNPDNPNEVWLFDPLKQYYIGGTYSDNALKVAQLGGGSSRLSVMPQVYDAILFVRHTMAATIDPGILAAKKALRS